MIKLPAFHDTLQSQSRYFEGSFIFLFMDMLSHLYFFFLTNLLLFSAFYLHYSWKLVSAIKDVKYEDEAAVCIQKKQLFFRSLIGLLFLTEKAFCL